jgi:prepilin-type N-terminal cleavage/methylation domain-containing protein/prepilin-type processing-associated H-X9-DG protein
MKTIRDGAFTLVELLVVFTIIGVLAALLFPALRSAIAARDEAVALSNMRQVGVAFSLYENDNSYLLPSRVEPQPGDNNVPDKWPRLLAKYLGDIRVYASTFDTQNYLRRHLSYYDALSNNFNNTSFIMNGYNDMGAFNTPSVQIRANAFPDTSNIILLGTPRVGSRQFYMDFEEPPNGNENDVLDLAAFHGGSNYLFADGSAKFIMQKDYQNPSPDPSLTGKMETYGNWLWKVNKTYQIPQMGTGGS